MAAADPEQVLLERLEGMISRFDREREVNKRFRFCQYLKLATLLAGGVVTVAAGLSAPPLATAAIAASIVLMEWTQELFRYHDRWLSFRTTCEALKREKVLYLVGAGPYGDERKPTGLGERVEQILASEMSLFQQMELARRSQGNDGG